MDEWIDELLTTDMVCDIALPHLPKRSALELGFGFGLGLGLGLGLG